jgi:hypothetical protein
VVLPGSVARPLCLRAWCHWLRSRGRMWAFPPLYYHSLSPLSLLPSTALTLPFTSYSTVTHLNYLDFDFTTNYLSCGL